MNAHPLAPITDEQVETFWRDGATCLRGLFGTEWIEHMRAAVEDDLANPGPLAREYATKQGQRFLGDIGAWAVKPGLRQFVEQSPAAEIAARLAAEGAAVAVNYSASKAGAERVVAAIAAINTSGAVPTMLLLL